MTRRGAVRPFRRPGAGQTLPAQRRTGIAQGAKHGHYRDLPLAQRQPRSAVDVAEAELHCVGREPRKVGAPGARQPVGPRRAVDVGEPPHVAASVEPDRGALLPRARHILSALEAAGEAVRAQAEGASLRTGLTSAAHPAWFQNVPAAPMRGRLLP